MTVLRGYRCSVCKKETFEYQPYDWRRLRFTSAPMRSAGFSYDETGEVCSDACELKWWTTQINELEQEPDWDEVADDIREEERI